MADRCEALIAEGCEARYTAQRTHPPTLMLDHDRLQWVWIKRDGGSVVVRLCPFCGGQLPDAIWIALLVAHSEAD